MDEPALARKARSGDPTALAELLRNSYAIVRGYLLRVTFDRALADDLTQATMERAIRRFDTWDGRARCSTWLVGIASRLYLDTLRTRAREARLVPPLAAEELIARAPDPEAQDVLRRLSQLPKDLGMAIVLKHAHGFTYEEIAEVTGWPTGTVKSRVSHALAEWREEAGHDA